jgi:hypothetical protein
MVSSCPARPCRTCSTCCGNSSRRRRPSPRRRWPSAAPPSPRAAAGIRYRTTCGSVRCRRVGCRPTGWMRRGWTRAGCWCSCTAGGSSSGRWPATGNWPPGWGGPPACGCCFRSTGWRPSTGSRPPWMMSGRCGTGRARRPGSDLHPGPARRAGGRLPGRGRPADAAGLAVVRAAGRAAATKAGVDVTLHVGDGLPHVYPIMAGTPEAAQATDQTGTFLRARVP